MAKIVVKQGRDVSLQNDYGIAAVNVIDAGAVSNFGTLLDATTTIAAASSKVANALTSAVLGGTSVVTAVVDFLTSEANFTITTITLHRGGNDVFTDLYGGVDGQSFLKTSDVALKCTLTDSRTSG